MHIKLINKGTEGEVVFEGRLDTNTSPDAEKVLLQLAERFDKLTLNFAGLEYISSAGLRVMKRLYSAMAPKNGEIVLKNVNKMVMEVFEMTGFVSLFRFI